MLAKDLMKKEIADLEKLSKETKDKLAKIQADVSVGKGTELGKIRTLRKDCARIRTVINRKGK
jgi:ribosomal protein L29